MARGDSLSIPRPGRNNDYDQIRKEFDRVKEKVEKLTGERGDTSKSLSAVRRSDLKTLASVELKSTQVTTVTAADFNALQRDVAFLHDALKRIAGG